jgi:hypothetical protein
MRYIFTSYLYIKLRALVSQELQFKLVQFSVQSGFAIQECCTAVRALTQYRWFKKQRVMMCAARLCTPWCQNGCPGIGAVLVWLCRTAAAADGISSQHDGFERNGISRTD